MVESDVKIANSIEEIKSNVSAITFSSPNCEKCGIIEYDHYLFVDWDRNRKEREVLLSSLKI